MLNCKLINTMFVVRYYILFNAIVLFVRVSSSVDSPPRVVAPCGPLSGTVIQARGGRNISAFLGIPYALPPLGNLRFESPVPAQPWTQELIADKQPKRCYQTIAIEDATEDCLYLNVYTPSLNGTSAMAVAVYIYSGGFDFGAVEDYTPEYILEEADIVFVVIQYRLNMFGWFSTGDSVVPGNMGLKDVLLGLTWIQDNICSFGGDPTKVTIWGESSAGAMVHLLMIFAADRGLFRSVIGTSQTALSPRGFLPPKQVADAVPVFAELSNCPLTPTSELVACLREIPALQLFYIYEELYKNKVHQLVQETFTGLVAEIGPVLEPACVKDRVVTSNPWYSNTSIPWLTGVNSKECLFFFRLPLNDLSGTLITAFNAEFDITFPLLLNYEYSSADGSKVPQAVRDFYLDNLSISRTTLPQAVDAFSDGYFIYGVYEAIQRANKDLTFVYYLEHIGTNQLFQVPQDTRVGVSHADELFYFFPHPALPFQTPRSDPEYDVYLSKTLIKLWTNFIRHMNPNFPNQDGINWIPYSNNESYLYIKQAGFETANIFLPNRMKFWENQQYPVRNDVFGDLPCNSSFESTLLLLT